MTDLSIGILGLGYVGLPLAVELAKFYPVFCFDKDPRRIAELLDAKDWTGEVDPIELEKTEAKFSSRLEDLKSCTVYIVAVPTPLHNDNTPDLSHLQEATRMVAGLLKRGDLVIYESTVFPGCTEEICVPILESVSKLQFNIDFNCGYSPERTNPGDKSHRLKSTVKITSGSTSQAAEVVDTIYKKVALAGTYKATTIRIAEAAKIIENAQRDINIAFVNELAIIFNRMGLDTNEVLNAASTKWNFAPFKPGLVGGHCVSVDPYYLTFKAEELGYHPEVILAGRRINDNMGSYVASRVVKLMAQKLKPQVFMQNERPKILIMGVTFKENCPDSRNSRVMDIYRELCEFGCQVDIYDPLARVDEVFAEHGVNLLSDFSNERVASYNALVFAVAHRQFFEIDIKKLKRPDLVIYDVKGIFQKQFVDERL